MACPPNFFSKAFVTDPKTVSRKNNAYWSGILIPYLCRPSCMLSSFSEELLWCQDTATTAVQSRLVFSHVLNLIHVPDMSWKYYAKGINKPHSFCMIDGTVD